VVGVQPTREKSTTLTDEVAGVAKQAQQGGVRMLRRALVVEVDGDSKRF